MMAETMRSTRGFLPDLKERCAFVEEAVRYKELASDAELKAYKPGGEENPDRSQRAWVFWFANLVRFNAREELKEARREIASEGAERIILEALMDAPVYVDLQPIGDEEPRRIAAHPKSYEALVFIDRRDRNISWLNEQARKLLLLPPPTSSEALATVDRETLHQYGLIVFAVTHAGAGVPFPADDPPKVLPDWIRELSTVDVIRIHSAYLQVNVLRLHALYALLEMKIGEAEPNRLTWATFFSTRAEETGVPPQSLMRDRSVGSQIAAALIAAEARNRALAESKKETPDNG